MYFSLLNVGSIIFFIAAVYGFRCNVTYPPTAIDCSGLGMDTLPEHLKHQIAVIMLMPHNKLNSTTSFDDWSNLRSLDVSYNSIGNISRDTFKSLINLKVLNISYNNFNIISEEAFDHLNFLEVLDLSGNSVVGYDYTSLQQLLNGTLYRSLKKLVMRYSDLHALPESFFKYAFELQYLDLSHNKMTEIPVLPSSLVYLDISYNNIVSISIVPLHSAHSLRNLFLDYNTHLSSIDSDAFETTKKLRNVSFEGCKNLSSLPPHLFHFIKNMTHLSLANCSLKTLPKQYRNVLLKIPSLQLEDNPWVCNASLKWFIFLQTPAIDKLRCFTPTNSTVMEYYGTNFHHTALRQLLLGLILVVFILFGLGIYFSFTIEKKRRLHTPYVPLQGKHPLHNPVYITTVV